ncbi:carotenoid oxygenase family protein [Streptomyces sp. NPDC059697]|uniref:carotenoid oxygenase family protein n=1 Tax=Streptomyces sp. NPDC059697 TaxID=3346912 RepID=UPI0036BD3911
MRTPAVLAEEKVARALWGGLESMIMPGPADVSPDLADTFKDPPDINVVRHGGRILALAESACPFRVSPDLDTLGKETFGGALPSGITAHPKIDPLTGEMAVFRYGLEPPWLTWSIIGPDATVRRGPTVVAGVDEPMMVHDLALTSRFLVLVLAPAFFDLPAAMSGGSFIAWCPERGTRVALVPRDGGPVRWAEDEAFWLWHTVNAYDSPGRPSEADGPDPTVTLDYVQWPRLALGDSETSGSGRAADREGGSGLARAVIDPAAGDHAAHPARRLPRGVPARRRPPDRPPPQPLRAGSAYPWCGTPLGRFDALRWYDTQRAAGSWLAGNLSVGEPVFAPVPGDPSEDHGYWMTYATDRTDGTSWLLVFAAQEPEAGPVARVRIPVRVPLGLHGCWLPTEE